MQLPTRLSEVDLNSSHIDDIILNLEKNGLVKLGEQREVTPEISRIILETAL